MSNILTDLVVDFSICENNNCTGITIEDETGDYDATTNPYGFGVPNPTVGEVITAVLDITFPDSSTLSLNLKTLSLNTFPNVEFLITYSMLGLSGKLPDGVYLFTLTYTGVQIDGALVDWSSTTSKYIFLSCQATCCLNKLLASITPEDCMDCQDHTLSRVIKGFTYLDAADYSVSCGSRLRATKLLQSAQFICNQTTCHTC